MSLVIRPIQASDIDALYEFATIGGVGLTTLPRDKDYLAKKIAWSERSFAKQAQAPGEEYYLYVLEDTDKQRAFGTCGIEAAVGLTEPFYSYSLSKVVHACPELEIHNTIDVLTLCNDYTGATEICSLFLHPDYRHTDGGKLLSKCRFLLMADYPEKFSERIFAEMRGVSDEHGQSAFWEFVCKRFFSMDFAKADYLSGVSSKAFIAELMPKYPLYAPLLSEAARATICQPHPDTVPALKLLQKEGFRNQGYIDIFDAGPALECPRSEIRAIRKSRVLKCQVVDKLPERQDRYLITNRRWHDFRAMLIDATLENGLLLIDANSAKHCQIDTGDDVRTLCLNYMR